jgi:hypothetical protein
MNMTLGADRVRFSFNPGANKTVETLKYKSAELIDLVDQLRGENPEVNRLVALAQTHYEDAAMWAVKAATAGT